jgi:hypothetical protein
MLPSTGQLPGLSPQVADDDRRGEGHMQTGVILKEAVERLSPDQRQQH